MKKDLTIVALILLAGCSATTVSVAVAALGIAGAGLNIYCLSGGRGCSPALSSYARVITTEALQDAAILESGQSAALQLQGIIANLNADIALGNGLQGLSPSDRQEVQAIAAAATSVIALIQALIPPPTSGPAQPLAVSATRLIKLPGLNSKDRKTIAGMRSVIAAASMEAWPPRRVDYGAPFLPSVPDKPTFTPTLRCSERPLQSLELCDLGAVNPVGVYRTLSRE